MSKLKANELMTGNIVRIKETGRVIQITVVDASYETVCYFDADAEGELTIEIRKIEPIPLTAEILEKNGFVKSRIDKGWLQWNQKQGGLVDIFIDNKGISGMPMAVTFGHNVVNMHTHYVHELQHALRLCGIDKEIVL